MTIRFVIYGMLGWCAEIVFTAITHRLRGRRADWRLEGTTYLWMFPLYGLIAPLYEPVHDRLRSRSWPVRGLVYTVGFFLVEFLGGAAIKRLIGVCPWDYSRHTRWHVRGLIRLDYAPIWFLAGLGLEPVHDFLVRLTPEIRRAAQVGSRVREA